MFAVSHGLLEAKTNKQTTTINNKITAEAAVVATAKIKQTTKQCIHEQIFPFGPVFCQLARKWLNNDTLRVHIKRPFRKIR